MNIANRITILRILLVPFFIGSIIYYRSESRLLSILPLAIFFTAMLTDVVDGFIARRFNQKTELGTILDPIADKVLIITAFICLSVSKSIPSHLQLPAWVPIIIISRDIIIVIGSVVIHLIKGDIELIPSVWGKATTFFQMTTVLSVLLMFRYSFIIWNIAVALTIFSGIDYMIKGSR
ncbi:MAG: CDP-diacylglycerol--glycerol-3-phosphate 3-phosphatidyltransferase, partial [Candidatus Omnitrophica bacterium]|nr:CDP-diacylglycerol--glycerol-3-phosphate 3-phosphatidyltransferase [Candidatus Omnitrophota bacterium]